jgi:hypothetical protein
LLSVPRAEITPQHSRPSGCFAIGCAEAMSGSGTQLPIHDVNYRSPMWGKADPKQTDIDCGNYGRRSRSRQERRDLLCRLNPGTSLDVYVLPLASTVAPGRRRRSPSAWQSAAQAGRIGWGPIRGGRGRPTNSDRPCANAVAVSPRQIEKSLVSDAEDRGAGPSPARRRASKIGRLLSPRFRGGAGSDVVRDIGRVCVLESSTPSLLSALFWR